MININPIIDAMRAAGHDPDFDIASLTVSCRRLSRDEKHRCSLSVHADIEDVLGFVPPFQRCGIVDRSAPVSIDEAAGTVTHETPFAPLAIVGWFDDEGAHLTSWIGASRRIRVRNFDPSHGLDQRLTVADIVESGGTEVVVLVADDPPFPGGRY